MRAFPMLWFSLAFSSTSKRRGSSFVPLLPPSVIYEDNHIVIVNKPVGWHSVPNPDGDTKKCLLTYVKEAGWGGGSKKDFVKSVHRIDQPCSGLLVFGKTSKAATRLTKAWKDGQVVKDYLVVVHRSNMPWLEQFSKSTTDPKWHELSGSMQPRPNNKVQTVSIRPSTGRAQVSRGKEVRLVWTDLSKQQSSRFDDVALLQVRTNQGARHMVRAVLGQVGGAPLLGDLRYGKRSQRPLPDQSVALHAVRLSLPSVVGSDRLTFQAPLPDSWRTFFGLKDKFLRLQPAPNHKGGRNELR